MGQSASDDWEVNGYHAVVKVGTPIIAAAVAKKISSKLLSKMQGAEEVKKAEEIEKIKTTEKIEHIKKNEEIFEKEKELENANKKIEGIVQDSEGVGKATHDLDLTYVWKLNPTERGKEVEKILASTEYNEWYNIGASQHGYFPVIDFQKGNNVISLKTIDPCLSSMSGSGATNKVIEYLDDLNRKVTVDGKLANKLLDVRIPEGTINQFDLDYLNRESKSKGIRLIIKEFK